MTNTITAQTAAADHVFTRRTKVAWTHAVIVVLESGVAYPMWSKSAAAASSLFEVNDRERARLAAAPAERALMEGSAIVRVEMVETTRS